MKFVFVASVMLLSAMLPVQSVRAADSDNAIWGIVSTTDRIRQDGANTRWRYGVAAQWRNFQEGSGRSQYLLRSSLGYDLRADVTLWAGFDYFLTNPDVGSNRVERRLWQQVAWAAHSWERASLSFRWRLEERDLENADDIGLRFRQMAQLTIPLEAQDLTAIVSAEHFVNFKDTDWGARSGFDQFRSYAGLRMPLTDKASLEAGYMHQYTNRTARSDTVNHTAMLHLRVKFR